MSTDLTAETTIDTSTILAAVARIAAAVEADGRTVGVWMIDCWGSVIDAYVSDRPDLAAGMVLMSTLGVADPQVLLPAEDVDAPRLVGVMPDGITVRMPLAR